ncbi:MAG TPA: AI-2E family transporter [Candidatus Saccharimonadales bacterium]|nr:AI-2E family transporter [Candidatus Saccharimonadales bacterium]
MSHRRTNIGFLIVLVGTAAIGMLVWPVFPGLTLAAVLATLLTPAHRRVLAKLHRPWLAATVSTVAAGLLILLPLTGVMFIVGTEAMAGIEWLTEREAAATTSTPVTEEVRGTIARTALRFGINPGTVVDLAESQVRRAGGIVAARTLSFLSGIPGALLQLGVAMFALFYLLRDGEEFMQTLRRMVPLEPERTDELLSRARDITYATVFGNVLVALAQGTIGGIAFRILGMPAAALWGTIMAVMSMIPMVGPAIVWIPASIYLAATGHPAKGLILTGIGILVIGTVDNVIRAIFVGGRARVHSLVVFLSVLGGVLVFGAAGIVVGPVLFVLALIAIEAGRLAMKGDDYVGVAIPTESAKG